MLSFKEFSLEDKDTIQSYILKSDRMNCDLSFANLYSWNFLYQTKYAIVDEILVLRFYVGEQLAYMMPVGSGDMKKVIKLMMKDAENIGSNLIIAGLTDEDKNEIDRLFPNRFEYAIDRDFSDYIYLRSDLASLSGKKYQPKRNHINKFKTLYPNYKYVDLTPELVPECIKLEEIWCRANNCEEQAELSAERTSMNFALNNMDKLGIKGGVLYVDEKIVAFTYGAIINNNTWDVCVEKADTTIPGAYPVINYEYANKLDEKFIYLNREEDLGLEGLRKAKLSYKPTILLNKIIAELK